MTIGERNRYITINRRSDEVDAANESVGWVLYKRDWAEITGQSGMARIRSDASGGGINTDLQRYSIRVNYDVTLTNAMQVVDSKGIAYDIQTVSHDHARRDNTYLVCQQGGSNG